MRLGYRPEIDGLRALAIGGVLIYHLQLSIGGVTVLQGGYLGVDVFFVISGYLIASIILSGRAQGAAFSYWDFYERRARRLLPALLVVLAASAVAASVILTPGAMVRFAQSALASIFFVSNIFWDSASQQYGATSGLYAPLLHTWSLAVEEQFYILFPTLFLLGLRLPRRLFLRLCAGLIALGLVTAEYLSAQDHAFSFYWLISRIWELLAGATLAVWRSQAQPSRDWTKPLPSLGLAIILGTMLLLPFNYHHPGFVTLPTVLGTCLILGFATPTDPATRLLSARLPVALGLISYSLYLWHYPIYAFGRLLRPDLTALDYLAWLILSLTLAMLTYRFIEQPFRDRARIPLPRLSKALGTASAGVAVFALAMIASDGARARLPGLIALYGPNDFDNAALADASWTPLAAEARAAGMAVSGPRYATPFERTANWFNKETPQHRVLLVGDSHSKDMFNVLSAAAEDGAALDLARFALPLDEAPAWLDTLLSAPNFKAADTVALSYRYYDEGLAHLPGLITTLRAAGKEVVVFSNTVEFPEPGGMTLFDVWLRQEGALDVDSFNARAYGRRSPRPDPINATLAQITAERGAMFYDKSEFICQGASCALVTPMGYKTMYDYGHYTLEGAEYFGKRVSELGWFTAPTPDPPASGPLN